MKDLKEPYAKENNLLQLSLFYFGKGRPERAVTEWSDQAGKYKLECVCKFGIPGSFDQDVYTACMRIWVKQGMPKGGIKLNYSDIARELGLEPPRAWVKKVRQSLEKLGQARYQFTQCFVKADKDGNRKMDAHFSLFDAVILFRHEKGKSKRNSESELIFSEKIAENLEAKYYQLLDLAWYRALPEGLPRRLYEYLEKKRYRANVNGEFFISQQAICRWLPVTDSNPTRKQNTLERIANELIKAGYLNKYEFDHSRKVCTYTYAKPATPKEVLLVDALPTKTDDTPQANSVEQTPQPDLDDKLSSIQGEQKNQGQVDQGKIVEALAWLDGIPYFHKDRRKEIAQLSRLCELFPSIKQEYERLTGIGKRPKAGWVYKAFKDGYRFDPNVQEDPQAA
ncbi:MAG: replication initiator protein A, partial [Nitrospirota bacterium]